MKRLAVAVALASLIAAACSDDGPNAGSGETASAQGSDLTVSAASSLTDAFTEIGKAFEKANAGTAVAFNFGPSDGLAGQIDEGAPVDVFASASPTWMDSVQDDGPGVTSRVDFAQNRLAIIVPAGNPAGIVNLNDLTEDGVQLVLAAEGVPAGDYAREILKNAGIETESHYLVQIEGDHQVSYENEASKTIHMHEKMKFIAPSRKPTPVS